MRERPGEKFEAIEIWAALHLASTMWLQKVKKDKHVTLDEIKRSKKLLTHFRRAALGMMSISK